MGTLIDELNIVVAEGRHKNLRPDVIRTELKEKLQACALDFIYNNPRYNHLIFYGGTCLRKCFNSGRMSEDIDCETTARFDKKAFADDIKRYFIKTVFFGDTQVFVLGKNMGRVELRFPVLKALGLSPHGDENLILKIEVNTINREYPSEFQTLSEGALSFVVRRYDLPTLMAGKMLACLERVWEKRGVKVKGRDYFDLLWYMQKSVIPNSERLLNSKGAYTTKEAFAEIAAKVSKINPADLAADLEPLFEDIRFVKNWVSHFHEEFARLYQNYNH